MKIAIHHTPDSFSERWIAFCKENNIVFKLVNCYDSDIINQLHGCAGLMWHWNHNDYKAVLIARQLTLSIVNKGVKVFPDVNTAWHFDDKLGQKYLLESINAPLVNSYVYYTKKEAMDWLEGATFPKVFKLRGGAGSVNVQLVETKSRAQKLVRKAFGKGFLPINRFNRLNDRFLILKRDKNLMALRGMLSGLARLFMPTEIEKFSHKQKGYIYFQDFIPNNQFDTRLELIGNRCYGMRRFCRKGDFRASGSGNVSFNPELIDKKCIRIAFDIAKKLKLQSVAFDFVNKNKEPQILEISYCFPMDDVTDDCPGYWDQDINWHDKPINAQYFMIEDFLNEINKNLLLKNKSNIE